MRKSVKFIILLVSIILTFFVGLTIYYLVITGNVDLDEGKINDAKNSISYFDDDNNLMLMESNSIEIMNIEELPTHLKNAFIAIEDKRFYSHKGVDYRGLLRASVKNLKSFKFAEGGSTITQQLIKNTQLTSDKTIKRKLIELKLAKKLEKKYSKEEILEKYLNTIYFGNNCFGISSATKYYFNKLPNELSILESATLAGIIKAPSIYSPLSNIDKCKDRRNLVLEQMYKQNFISKNDYENFIKEDVKTYINNEKLYRYDHLLNKEVDEIIDKLYLKNQKINVFTYYDKNVQNIIENMPYEEKNCDKTSVVMSIDAKVKGYLSTCGNVKRQLGSTIKPLVVYAPAIENDVIDSCTKILDEKTDFGNFAPSNYNDKYYGYLSAKECLAKSLNIPAVKILNYVGIEKAKEIINKTNVKLTENDNTLGVALGSTENGYSLTDITSSYSIFANEGLCYKARCVKEITDNNGKVVYKDNNENNKVLSDQTAYIVSEMLKETVNSGTAKKLKMNNADVRAKTGTVGNQNGNTDAYSISYTGENIVGVWFGNANNTLMDNDVVGGSYPTDFNRRILEKLYNGRVCNDLRTCDSVKTVAIDKVCYDDENVVKLACENTPKRFLLNEIFKSNRVPLEVSTTFLCPKVEILKTQVNNKQINIELCLTKHAKATVYKYYNDKKIMLKDIDSTCDIIIDDISDGETYYSIIPYFDFDGKIIYGEEIFSEKIKPLKNISGFENDKWWDEEY